MNNLQIVKTFFVIIVLTVLSSCGSSDSSKGEGETSSSDTGRVSLLLTDGPTDDFDQINITLESIRFLSDDDETAEVVLFEETRIINLLALQNYSDWLSTATVPVGTYSKIRLNVSQVELVNLDEQGNVLESNIAKLPANGKIDLNPRGTFDVVSDSNLMIELDMDANKSIQVVVTGNGKYIFRPVIFVNILGEEELKLVLLDGKVLAKSETGFQLCNAEIIRVDDSCMAVVISDNTVVQDALIDVVDSTTLENNVFVTVLGKAGSEKINALHIVIAADAEVQNQALFTGIATSAVGIDNSFGIETDDDNDVVPPGSALSVNIAAGARIFDKFGAVITNDKIVNGSDVDVFGLAMPDLVTIDTIKAAFVIADNEVEPAKQSGVIAAINGTESELTITVVDGLFSGDVCVDVSKADMFLLSIAGDNISSQEITINDLQTGLLVDVYSDDDNVGCLSAEVVLVSEI